MSLLFTPPLETLPLKAHPKGVLLYVKASPNASKNAFGKIEASLHHPVLKIYITAIAEDGKANKAIIDFLAESLDLKKTHIVIVSGATDRLKTFLLHNMTIENILKKIPI